MNRFALFLLGVIALIGVTEVIKNPSEAKHFFDPPPPTPPLLNVHAGSTPRGFAMTNYEATPATDCDLTILGEQVEWDAFGGRINPVDTVSIPWDDFMYGTHRLPPYLQVHHIRLVCTVEDVRKSADFRF